MLRCAKSEKGHFRTDAAQQGRLLDHLVAAAETTGTAIIVTMAQRRIHLRFSVTEDGAEAEFAVIRSVEFIIER